MTANAQTGKLQHSLVEKIAEKFNLNTGDVEQVFDENRQDNKAQHDQMQKEHLTSLVTAGKLTQEQADVLKSKFAELKAEREANHESMKAKTSEERKADMEARKAEIEQWAKDNGIDVSIIKSFDRKGHRPGHN